MWRNDAHHGSDEEEEKPGSQRTHRPPPARPGADVRDGVGRVEAEQGDAARDEGDAIGFSIGCDAQRIRSGDSWPRMGQGEIYLPGALAPRHDA